MVLLRRKTVVAASIETTPYTLETLVAADSNFNIYDAVVTPALEFRQRPATDSFSQRRGTVEPRSGSVTFMTDITGDGSGGVPSWASLLLPPCGFVATGGVFKPSSKPPGAAATDVKTLTIGVHEDGRRKLLRGCAGTFNIVLESGRDARIEWTFTGAWAGVTDSALFNPVYPTQLPLRFANSGFTVGGASPCLQAINIDAGNNVIMREDATAADGSGFKGGIITDRVVVGDMDPEADLVADFDVFGNWIASTESAINIVMQDATDVVTINMPKTQSTNITDGDRNSLRTDPITFQANRDSGDDELTITFAAPTP